MSNNCFSTLNGYEVKDTYAREKVIENAQAIADVIPYIEQMMDSAGKVPFTVYPEQYGAVGDGVNDDTDAINAALAENLSVSLMPGKVYAIDGEKTVTIPANGSIYGNGATLKVIPNSAQIYTGIFMGGSNSRMENLVLLGERNEHTGEGGEWGHGLSIGGNADGVVVRDCTIRDFWGDGIYANQCSNVFIENVVVDNSRRNGISVIAAKDFRCVDCLFINTNGTAPQSGISVEANYETDVTQGILFERCKSINSVGDNGFYATVRASDSDVTFRNCYSDKGFSLTSLSGERNHFEVIGCNVIASSGLGMVNTQLSSLTDSIKIDGCVIDGSKGAVCIVRQLGHLLNTEITNTKLINGTFGRRVLWLGDRSSGKNNFFDIKTENVSFSEINTPLMYGDLNTMIMRAENKTPYDVSGLTVSTMEINNVITKGTANTVAVHFTSVHPGTIYRVTNLSGVSVKIQFESCFMNGANTTNTPDLPNLATMYFSAPTSGRVSCWIA